MYTWYLIEDKKKKQKKKENINDLCELRRALTSKQKILQKND